MYTDGVINGAGECYDRINVADESDLEINGADDCDDSINCVDNFDGD